VAAGGSLVATHETSLYDEWGAPRPQFGLADLFGAKPVGRVEGPMQNSYLRLNQIPGPGSVLLAGFEDVPRIINGVWRVPVEPSAPFLARLTLIPSYPDLPMEMVYPRGERADLPQVFANEIGGGRVVYFPWDIDRTFWEVMSPDHGRLFANAVDWATNEERPVTVSGPGLLDVTIWRQQSSLTVHLVNLTNPMMMRGPIRAAMPVGEQRVRIKLDGAKAAGVHLLVSGQTPRVDESGGYLTVTVPSILEHEVVAVDL
jgi:hypothetical protein